MERGKKKMSRKKGLTIGKTRSALYTTARVLGHINAVKRGKVGTRVLRVVMGKTASRIFSKLLG